MGRPSGRWDAGVMRRRIFSTFVEIFIFVLILVVVALVIVMASRSGKRRSQSGPPTAGPRATVPKGGPTTTTTQWRSHLSAP